MSYIIKVTSSAFSPFCNIVHSVLFSFTDSSLRKREIQLYCFYCVGVCVHCLLLRETWAALWSVIVPFPGHIRLYFDCLIAGDVTW